jgi:hypothetical protein
VSARSRRLIALLVALAALAAPALANAVTYRGAGVDDPEMPVKVKVVDGLVTFEYTQVLVACTGGTEVRQGGAVHSAHLNERSRFRDTLTIEGTTSLVRGAINPKRATGTVAYELVYEGGECHSGKLEWRAKRH